MYFIYGQVFILPVYVAILNTSMNEIDQLIAQGNQYREETRPWDALACYANAFVRDPNNAGAWCNYGNVLRELGYPERSIPFLQHSAILDPSLKIGRAHV